MNGLEKEQLSSVCDRFSKKSKDKSDCKKRFASLYYGDCIVYCFS